MARKQKKLAEKFDKINRANVRGKVGHTRTGACTHRLRGGGKCNHGWRR